jgi:hypothetical protein
MSFSELSTIALASLLSIPAIAAIPAHPGMLNYVEGQASIGGQQVTSKQVGTAEVAQGQVLETGTGKAEILLTPGVFLRLGENSAVRVDSAGLTKTSLELLQGKALVEATDLKEQNNIRIADHGTVTTLKKNGLYQFDANQGEVAVYDGKVQVRENDRTVDLKKGKETSTSALHVEKFDRNQTDDLYNWSNLRSQYLSQASAASARTYLVGGSGWSGGGWYWNPYFTSYSYLPGDGFLYSPFGYGFYSPFGYRAYYGGYGNGYGYYRGGNRVIHSGDSSGNFGRGTRSFTRPVTGTNQGFGRTSGFTAHSGVAVGGGFGRGSARR